MNNFLNQGLIQIKKDRYLALLIVIAPLLNFLSGITFDLHAPSLPAIAMYFSAPMSAAKNTITISLLGFAIGCIVWGTLLDIFGRRRIILLGLLLYAFASFSALACKDINQLLLVRLIQGLSVSSLSVGCRAVIIDNFTSYQFKIALLYTSVAFGLGPIIAPFIGGILQYHFGWKANFIVYGLVSLVLMSIFALYVNESLQKHENFSFKKLFDNYKHTLGHLSFIAGILIAGFSQVQLLVYTTVGSFLIENVLHCSAIIYGNSALVISCGYLLGTLTNRYFIKRLHLHHLSIIGFLLLIIAILIQIVFTFLHELNLLTIIFPITLIGFSNGFIFPNILSASLRLFPTRAGIATALFTCGIMVIGTIGTAIVSYINVGSLIHLTAIFAITSIVQFLIFFKYFINTIKEIP
ncbi:hypothetical protein AYO45_01760 [Gammaproteobacteria bacterium SCGC AG-212-F23]|nr:hypothetical protein AYO45_01760 [Gammaproteobacteria bacterium SCGC AG-212-F23]